MSCLKNEQCNKLATTTYPNFKESINTNISNINQELNEVATTLNGFDVPTDHLGNKVIEVLDNINNEILKEKDFFSNQQLSVNNFIDSKINEHKQHYKEWKELQNKKSEEESFNLSNDFNKDDNMKLYN